MKDLARQDKRITVLTRKKNGGIARATNDGLKAAKGEFVAFFDHDDLLEPTALEIMLLAYAATGAKLLYSDEDKEDRSGALSEPHFKPDFNNRFLLDINYICHLILVDAEVLRASLRLKETLRVHGRYVLPSHSTTRVSTISGRGRRSSILCYL